MTTPVLQAKHFLSESADSFDSVSMEVHLEKDDDDEYLQLSGNFRLCLGGGVSAHEWMIAGYADDDSAEMVERVTTTLAELASVREALNTYATTAETELRKMLYQLLGVPVIPDTVAA